MAKGKGKQPNSEKERQKKKNFWSHFFEPVPPDEESDPASANRQYGEPPEPPLKHLFSDEELEFSDVEDAENMSRLMWDDGEKVVSDTARVRYSAEPGPRKERAQKQSGEEPIQLFDDDAGYETEEGPREKRGQTTRTRIFRTGASTTARIHINETEESVRMAEAEKKARAREAARKHEEYVERQVRRKKNGETLKKMFGNLAFVLVILVAVLVALYYGFLLSDVVVIGNDQYSADYIVELSGLKLGTHMLFCDLDQAEANISEEPYLQVDSITYIFPSRVRIVVSERKEVAGIVGLDNNVIIDKNGYVLDMSGGTDLTGLIQVTGVSMTGFQLGEKIGQDNDFSTATLVELISALEDYSLTDSIQSIDLTTPLAITMVASNGLTIHVGQATDLDSKMDVLAKLLPEFVAKNVSTGTLYLSAKGGTVYSPTDHENLEPVTLDTGDSTDTGDGTDNTSTFIDEDGDGLDDNTGLAYATTSPTATPQPTTPGGEDDFSG
ncbi:MAG TPA: FtsQ-type POTRA domain-containing protein [Eubacteriales bacterium]|nr:FtsQ-type POTRA domain-containing protein [Eubacteriales bacterium]